MPCRGCGQTGHWVRECPNAAQGKMAEAMEKAEGDLAWAFNFMNFFEFLPGCRTRVDGVGYIQDGTERFTALRAHLGENAAILDPGCTMSCAGDGLFSEP